ncbi:MAG: FecR family protein [Congregibacter sp.]|nr:FecR family protein [Congregibacter sp.]
MESESAKNKLSEERIGAILTRVGPRPTPSADAESAVKTQVYQAWMESVQVQRRQRRQWSYMAAAASVMLTIAATLFVPWGSDYEPGAARLALRVNNLEYSPAGAESWETAPESARFVSGDRLRLSEDSYAALTMSNGTELRLDQSTELRFVSEDSVFLQRGALYADAAGESTLRVITSQGSAQDIGTRFEVRVGDNSWQVQVREGRVVLDDQRAGTAFADAGERLIAEDDGFVKEPVSLSDTSWTWTQAAVRPMVIEGTLLKDYLHWWSRESGVVVKFQSDIDQAIAGQTLLHGSLDGLSLNDGLRVVLSSSGYHVVDNDDKQLTVGR